MLDFYKKRELPVAKSRYSIRQGDDKYLPSEELKKAVDVALLLNKPLLLTGLPGTGKTDLAFHIARHFNLGDPLVFHTRTTAAATDILYQYNSLAHFQFSRHHTDPLTPREIEDKFISYEALGQAIRDSRDKKVRVVLIDEIDKAPRDLPNDILDIVENMRFSVPELKVKGHDDISHIEGDKDYKPLLILTSNSEKSLPEPFLRRCVFFYIEQPEGEHLREILKLKLEFPYSDEQWDTLIAAFDFIKKEIRGKKPATAELIAWAWLLDQYGISPEMLKDTELSGNKKADLLSSFSVLAKDNEDWKRIRELKIKI